MPLHIMGHAQVQYKDSFLLVGGRGGSNSSSEAPSKQIYEYNIAHGNWTLWSTTQDTSLVSALIIRDPCNNCSSAMDDVIGNEVGNETNEVDEEFECPRVVGTLLGLNRITDSRMPKSHGNLTSSRMLKVFRNLIPRRTAEPRLGQLLVCLVDGVLSASSDAAPAVLAVLAAPIILALTPLISLA